MVFENFQEIFIRCRFFSEQHKTNWMLPALVLAIFFLIMWVCSLILLPIFGLVANEQIQGIIDEAAGSARVESMDSTTFLIVSWVFAAIATGVFHLINNVLDFLRVKFIYNKFRCVFSDSMAFHVCYVFTS